jgi:hypothetical protein
VKLHVFALSLLAACGASEEREPASEAPAAPVDPVTLAEVPPPLHGLDAPVRLIVSPSELAFERLGERDRVIPLERGRIAAQYREGGGHGFLLPALRDAFDRTTEARADLWVDASIPYETVTCIVYTLGQSSYTALHFAVRAGETRGALAIEIPRIGDVGGPQAPLLGVLSGTEGALADLLAEGAVTDDPPPAADREPPEQPLLAEREPRQEQEPTVDETLSLSVVITAPGIIVFGSGGKLAPDCERTQSGRVITVPPRAGTHDWASFGRCLDRVHGAFPDARRIVLSADPEIPFRDFAQAMARARAHFPQQYLSAALR